MVTANDLEWSESLLRNPHGVADKRSRVQRMFTAIAGSYDLNNRLHSLWMDQRWRSKAVKMAGVQPGDRVVDVACGTGDLALKFARALQGDSAEAKPASGARVIGIDFTHAMLPIARAKDHRAASQARCGFVQGDAQGLPLPDGCCDVVSIAFGIRNVQEPRVAMREFARVLRPGGRLIVLEFSLPINPLLRALYNFYFTQILPRTATLISGDKSGAYRYLPQSVNTFLGREQILQMMRDAGLSNTQYQSLTFGVCICYRGVKV